MANLHILLATALAALVLFVTIFPNIPRNLKIKITLAFILVCSAMEVFNSNDYKHWRYFAENNVTVICGQIPPITADDKNFYYRYLIFLNNRYPESVKISDFQMKFQTPMDISSHEILVSDFPKGSLSADVEGNSILSARIDEFNGGQIFSLLADCSLPSRGYLGANRAATVQITYKLFGIGHSKSFFVNPMSEMSLQLPKQEAIVFDVFKVLDNRMLPKFFFTYNYPVSANKSIDQRLEIYCEDNKTRLLKIRYRSPSGVTTLVSECPVHKDFDPIRIVVLANNDISVYSWLGIFRRQDIASQFRQGIEFVNKRDYKAGAEAFKKVTELDARDYEAWFNHGLALVYIKDYKPAIDAFKNAIKVKGDYAKAHFQLGATLIETGDEKGAVVYLKRAIEINPKYALAYFNLGVLQIRQGNNAEGLRNTDQAIMYETRAKMRDTMKEIRDQIQGLKPGGSQAYLGDGFY